ncbi:hypothetical protein [Flavobacterium sp. NRK1]|jgi:predicted lipid-binding transport protein (Tim44 family)|uniref:hypothetical protein n=1 Tax=Flavobacterium sp. NRK1 TaxID=2954929 RepID=UPI0020929937|nr:hypothetical protein [Flavobacterium sp. NRK1]MCO6149542.1 hypothetical protein [Flavobacterium sp. NRK1]
MKDDKKPSESRITADDNMSNNAHYTKSGKVVREDERDQNDSSEEWNAEKSRTSRNK